MSLFPAYRNASPEEVQAHCEQGDPVRLVDVRQAWEYENSRIPGALLMPLGELAGRFASELDPAEQIICLCEHGIRSRSAAAFLAGQGYENVATMTGGMVCYHGPVEHGPVETAALESRS